MKKIKLLALLPLLVLTGCEFPADTSMFGSTVDSLRSFWYEVALFFVKGFPSIFLDAIYNLSNLLPTFTQDSDEFAVWSKMSEIALGLLAIFFVFRLYGFFIQKKEQDFRRIFSLMVIALFFIYTPPLLNRLFIAVFFGPQQESYEVMTTTPSSLEYHTVSTCDGFTSTQTSECITRLPRPLQITEGGLLAAFNSLNGSNTAKKQSKIQYTCLDEVLQNKENTIGVKRSAPYLFELTSTAYKPDDGSVWIGYKETSPKVSGDLWRGCNSVGALFAQAGNSYETPYGDYLNGTNYDELDDDKNPLLGQVDLKIKKGIDPHKDITIGKIECMEKEKGNVCGDLYQFVGKCSGGKVPAYSRDDCESNEGTWVNGIDNPEKIFFPNIELKSVVGGFLASCTLILVMIAQILIVGISWVATALMPLLGVLVIFDSKYIGWGFSASLGGFLIKSAFSLAVVAAMVIPSARDALISFNITAFIFICIIFAIALFVLHLFIRGINRIGENFGADLDEVTLKSAMEAPIRHSGYQLSSFLRDDYEQRNTQGSTPTLNRLRDASNLGRRNQDFIGNDRFADDLPANPSPQVKNETFDQISKKGAKIKNEYAKEQEALKQEKASQQPQPIDIPLPILTAEKAPQIASGIQTVSSTLGIDRMFEEKGVAEGIASLPFQIVKGAGVALAKGSWNAMANKFETLTNDARYNQTAEALAERALLYEARGVEKNTAVMRSLTDFYNSQISAGEPLTEKDAREIEKRVKFFSQEANKQQKPKDEGQDDETTAETTDPQETETETDTETQAETVQEETPVEKPAQDKKPETTPQKEVIKTKTPPEAPQPAIIEDKPKSEVKPTTQKPATAKIAQEALIVEPKQQQTTPSFPKLQKAGRRDELSDTIRLGADITMQAEKEKANETAKNKQKEAEAEKEREAQKVVTDIRNAALGNQPIIPPFQRLEPQILPTPEATPPKIKTPPKLKF